ncbi:hypothetical protein, partial [Pseudomonas syringae]|uniref:hypothetical protein n=1 Tax=Pseudomonas syringae TaxID=317 RepID=UPI0034D708C6
VFYRLFSPFRTVVLNLWVPGCFWMLSFLAFLDVVLYNFENDTALNCQNPEASITNANRDLVILEAGVQKHMFTKLWL